MLLKYLKNAVSALTRLQVTKHPHYSRSVIVADEVVSVDTYEDTSYDADPGVVVPSVPEQIKAGQTLKPMGSRPSSTTLEEARFAQEFVRQFNALGQQQPLVAPAVAEAPVVTAAPAEPVVDTPE